MCVFGKLISEKSGLLLIVERSRAALVSAIRIESMSSDMPCVRSQPNERGYMKQLIQVKPRTDSVAEHKQSATETPLETQLLHVIRTDPRVQQGASVTVGSLQKHFPSVSIDRIRTALRTLEQRDRKLFPYSNPDEYGLNE